MEKYPTQDDFRLVIRTVAPSGKRADFLAVLGKPVTWGLIRHWIEGRDKVPQWAADRIAAHLNSIAAIAYRRVATETKGAIGARALRAYHARRARERDEQAKKEKGEI